MRKILLLAVASFSLAFIACKSDDDEIIEVYSEANMIIGVWKQSKEVIISGADNSTVLDTYITNGCTAMDNFNFKNDGTYVDKIYGTSQSGQPCTLTTTSTGNYTYDPQTKALTITYSGGANGVEHLTVLGVNTTNMVVKNKIDDDNGDGIDDYVIITLYR